MKELIAAIMRKLGYVPIAEMNRKILEEKKFDIMKLQLERTIPKSEYIPVERELEYCIHDMKRMIADKIWELGDTQRESPAFSVPHDIAVHRIKFRIFIAIPKK